MSRSRIAALASALLLLALLAAPADAHRPLIPTNFADPSVAPYAGGLVAVSTGPHAPMAISASLRARWKRVGSALTKKPAWAANDGIWAADLKHLDHRWLLYFAAPVKGLGREGHCIGVAYARSPLSGFTPTARPLVCPRGARTPRGADRPRPRGLPRDGVIDPSVTSLRRHFLLYKTQGLPSSIRMVKLSRNGLHVAHRSVQLLRSRRIVENPQLVTRHHRVVLFASLGTFGTCKYATVWRSARKVSQLSRAATHPLLTTRATHICGPGGADVVEPATARAQIYFQGWICGKHQRPCPSGHNYDLHPRRGSARALYGARLVWRHNRPSARFVTRHKVWRKLRLRRGKRAHKAKRHQRPKHHRKHHRKRRHRRTKR